MAEREHARSNEPSGYKRLYRSRTDKIIAGVAGGVAQYFAIDPTIVRLLFLLLIAVTKGVGIILYLAAIVLIPKEPDGKQAHERDDHFEEGLREIQEGAHTIAHKVVGEHSPRGKMVFSYAIIAAGLFVLLSEVFMPRSFGIDFVVGLLLIGLGLTVIMRR